MRLPRLRLRLRTLMILVAVVAVAIGAEKMRRRWLFFQKKAAEYAQYEENCLYLAQIADTEVARNKKEIEEDKKKAAEFAQTRQAALKLAQMADAEVARRKKNDRSVQTNTMRTLDTFAVVDESWERTVASDQQMMELHDEEASDYRRRAAEYAKKRALYDRASYQPWLSVEMEGDSP